MSGRNVCEAISGTSLDHVGVSYPLGGALRIEVYGANFNANAVQIAELNPAVTWSTPTLVASASSATKLVVLSTPSGSACSTGGLTVTVTTSLGCPSATKAIPAGSFGYF